MKKRLLLFIAGVFLLIMQGMAQQITVTGRVTAADDGSGMPSVSVRIKGGTAGISTDAEGRYSIRAKQGDVLVFSFIGTISQERTVTGTGPINVQLRSDSRTLDEVAVTAFGIRQEVRSLGFATQNVKAREIVESQQPNIVNALQGKVAGVQITNSSGAAGSSANIMIRGGSSLSGNNQPLFVVDGIPVDNTTPISQGNLVAGIAPGSNRAIDLNPEDIATVTVLKGPAAAALYGIRAASGAIVITTKKGAGGAAQLTYTNTFSVDNVNKLPELQGVFKQGEQGLFSPTAQVSFGPAFAAGEPVYDNLNNFFKSAFTQSHDLSVSGSSERTTYYTSASLFDQGSIVDKVNFGRKSFRLNADTKIGDKLTVGGSANYVRTDREFVPQGSANGTMGVVYWPRNDDMSNYLNPNGSPRVLSPSGTDNPYWTIQNKPLTSALNRLIGIANIDYNPFSFLNLSYRLGTDFYTEHFKGIRMPGTREADALRGAITQNTNTNQITTSTFIATLKKDFGDYHFSLAAGQNLESLRTQNLTASAINFIDPGFASINNTVATDRSVSETISRRRIVGAFGDLNVDWKNIIYLNARARNDWTSTIPVENYSFFYPSVSASVVISDLFKELKIKQQDNVFSYGKLRFAYSDAGKDAPPHVTRTSLASVTNTFTINPRGFIINSNNPFGNPALVPEFTRSIEAGADIRFFKNRLGLDFTWYRSKSDNQILLTRLPPSSGAFLGYLNGGAIENKGVEFVLNARPVVSQNFNWSVDVNFSSNRSTVRELPGALDRVELSDSWVANNAAQGAAFVNGSLFGINGNVWKRNAQGQLLLGTNGYPQIQTALADIGDRNPDFISGITNTFNYKNISFSFLVDIRVGGDVFNGTENSLVRSGLSMKTLDRGTRVFEGIIESTGAVNTLAVPLNQNYYQTIYANQGYDFVEDGSWYRLRYATLTYNMPKDLLSKLKLKGLSFTLTGRNLILITDYTGVDPEVSGSGAGVGGTGSFGFDNLGVPATRGFDLGLKLTL